MSVSAMPHPVYFLVVKAKRQGGARFTAIKDENTGERFACVFVSPQDAEEFMVANDLTFDAWEIYEAKALFSVNGYCSEALRRGIYQCVVNPPPLIRGEQRTLPIERLRIWSRTAEEPLLVWAGYRALPTLAEEVEKRAGEANS